jgi:hypothetical protein
MDNETLRVNNWRDGFFKSLENDNSDLIPLFSGRIYFMPQQDKDNSIHPALDELDERYATKEQIERMRQVIEKYAAEHRV